MKAIHFSAAAMLLCLTVFGNLNLRASTCSISQIETLDDCPKASFSMVKTGADTYGFTNKSEGASTYLWDFGDGTTSTATHPSHVYGSAGNYTVKLYATGGGCTVEFIGMEDVVVS